MNIYRKGCNTIRATCIRNSKEQKGKTAYMPVCVIMMMEPLKKRIVLFIKEYFVVKMRECISLEYIM